MTEPSSSAPPAASGTPSGGDEDAIVVKVGMLGDAAVGKTSLMVRLIDGIFDEDYIYTLGVSFKEKVIRIRNSVVRLMVRIWVVKNNFCMTFVLSISHSLSSREMLGVVCNEANALLYCFDLTRPASLTHVRSWYMKSRRKNSTSHSFLVGTKFDKFLELGDDVQGEITKTARRYAARMHCPLVYCSAAMGINVKPLFKLVLSKVFDIPSKLPKKTEAGVALFEYD